MITRSVKSYAKINIALNIKSKKEDGYHELDTIMLPIEFHDSLIISELKTAKDNFVTIDDFADGIMSFNLVGDCIQALSKKYKFKNKFRVFIHKNIPIQAGLGGGSSNAAFTLKYVNQVLKLNASNEDLIELSKEYGADIPFFINNVPARCKGIGEKMEPIEIKNNYYVLLVKPKEGVSTKECFYYCDKQPYVQVNVDKVEEALKNGDDELLEQSLGNSMYNAAIQINPEISKIVDFLREKGLKIVGMSGSGSTVFALSQDRMHLAKILDQIPEEWFSELTKVLK